MAKRAKKSDVAQEEVSAERLGQIIAEAKRLKDLSPMARRTLAMMPPGETFPDSPDWPWR